MRTYREGADSEVQDPHINRELMGRIQSGMRPKLFPIPRSNGAPTTGSHANSDPPIVSVRVCVNPSRRGKTNNYASQKLFSSVNQVAVASPDGSCKTRISLQLQEMQHCNKHRIKHPSQNTHPVTWAQSLRILAVLRRFVRFTQIFFSLLPTPWRNVTPPLKPETFPGWWFLDSVFLLQSQTSELELPPSDSTSSAQSC